MQNKTRKSLQVALAKITESNQPIRQRLADAYNYGLIHLSDHDFIEKQDQEKIRKISDQLQSQEPGRMPTRAHRSAEKLTLDQATEMASDILDLCRNSSDSSVQNQ